MEARRQLIHLSGVLFVLLAQFTGREFAIAYFFIIAGTFLVITAKTMMAFGNLSEVDLSVFFYGKARNTERAYRLAFKDFFALETTPARVEES